MLYQGTIEGLNSSSESKLDVKVIDVQQAKISTKKQGIDAVHNHNSTLSINIESEIQVAAINRFLVDEGIDVLGLTVHQHNLEEVFIETN